MTIAAIAAQDHATGRMELGDAVEYYLLSASAEGFSGRTLGLYRGALTSLVGFARRHNRIWLDELTPTLLRGAVAAQIGSPGEHPANWQGGHRMATTLVFAARGMCRRLLRDGIPMADLSVVKPPKVPARVQPRLTRGEFLALEGVVRNRAFQKRQQKLLVARDLAILYLLADTGLRAAEFCALNVADVNFEEGTLTVRRGKGGKGRILSIADSDPHELDGGLTLRSIQTYLFHRQERELTEQPALWLTIKGQRMNPNVLRAALSAICVEAGIDGNRPPHAFRRGWFTEAYKSEPMALPVLVARMGWTAADGGTMARTYTRGVDLELARTELRPSLARQWRAPAAAPSKPPALAASAQPTPPASPIAAGPQAGGTVDALAAPLLANAGFREALLSVARTDPDLRQALVQALFGGAA